jgi:UDP-N-acetylmuramoyl-tripeptide--D-alanyl-D-alanine ligase
MKTILRTLVARRLEKRVQRLIAQNSVKVVAVTGSVGKTSTKLAIATVLRQKYRVLAHDGNFNSEIGLPFLQF